MARLSCSGHITHHYHYHTSYRTAMRIRVPLLFNAPSSPILPQHRTHSSHNHSSHDESIALLVSKDKSDPGVRITRIGLAVNLGLVVIKGAGGLVTHSASLIADAGHSLADLLSDFLTLSTLSLARRPATPMYPLGFGKVETLGALGVSTLLLVGGTGIGLSSLEQIIHQLADAGALSYVPTFLSSLTDHYAHHHHSSASIATDINAAWIAAGSVLVKEVLFRQTMKVSRETGSTVLAANAWHHRTDSLTSLVALCAIGGGHVFGWAWLDPLGGCLVAALITKAGLASGTDALGELVDRSMSTKLSTAIRATAAKTLDSSGSSGSVERIQGVKSGRNHIVDVVVAFPPTIPLTDANRIAQTITQTIYEVHASVKICRVQLCPKLGKE